MSPALMVVLDVGLWAVVASVVVTTWRLVRGPSLADRVLALDTLSINAIACIVLFGLKLQSDAFFEAALLVAMMGFVGTVSLSKHMADRSVIE